MKKYYNDKYYNDIVDKIKNAYVDINYNASKVFLETYESI